MPAFFALLLFLLAPTSAANDTEPVIQEPARKTLEQSEMKAGALLNHDAVTEPTVNPSTELEQDLPPSIQADAPSSEIKNKTTDNGSDAPSSREKQDRSEASSGDDQEYASHDENTEQVELWGPLRLLNAELKPNSSATLEWFSGHLSGGFELATPVIAIHGKQAGPRVCLTAAIHGDEVNGVEIARRIVKDMDPATLKGTIISIPVVNIDGLWRKDRYMSDRRDLNRAFPGSPNGSTASRVAYSLFTSIIQHCDSLVDLHSGSMFRENITQLRADLTINEVAELAAPFGAISIVQSIAPSGSLRGAATAAGIPAVVMEVGGPYTVDEELVETGVKALQSYLSSVEMLPRSFFWSSPQPIFYASSWVRSRNGGILINQVKLGATVNKGDILGSVSNPITGGIEEISAPFNAVVLGRAQNQFVSAGYAIYNLGERRKVEELEQEAEQIKQQVASQAAQQQGLARPVKNDTAADHSDSDVSEAIELLPESRMPQPEDKDG